MVDEKDEIILEIDSEKEAINEDIVADAEKAVERHKKSSKAPSTVRKDSEAKYTDVQKEDQKQIDVEIINRFEKEKKELKEQLLRVAADFDNYRKRTAREKEEILKFGITRLISDLLPVIDSFEMAIEHAKTEEDTPDSELVKGVKLALENLYRVFEKYGVQSFDPLGKQFDPHYHEALQTVESDKYPPNTIIRVHQKGYLCHERLIRPALVDVSCTPDKKEKEKEKQ